MIENKSGVGSSLKMFRMQSRVRLWVFLGFIPFCTVTTVFNSPDGKTCYGNICLDEDYDHDIWPSRKGSDPIIVDMRFEIDSILSVDSDMNIVGIQLSLQQTWMDNRVSARNESLVENGAFISAPRTLYKEPDTLPKLWMPTIWIFSMTNFEIRQTFADQSLLYLTRSKLEWPSTVERLRRHSPTATSGYFLVYYTQFDLYTKCNMKYDRFPFDRHLCYVNITSADLNANILKFATTPKPNWHYDKSDFNKTRQFDVRILSLEEYENETIYENTPWSITGFRLDLIRRRSEYVYNYMSTSGLCVIASWASFVIPPGDANARVAIFITMILVLVTIFNAVMEKTPISTGGPTAIVIWMLSMFMFVFVAFLGYCVALLLEKRRAVVQGNKTKKLSKNSKYKHESNSFSNVAMHVTKHIAKNDETPRMKYLRTHKWDLVSLMILSTSFMIYVTSYFMIYTLSNPYSNYG